MNFRTVFAVHRPVTSSTKCILQFWQRFSRTLEKSGGTSFAWLHEFCANRGLTCKMYGRVLKIVLYQFSIRPPERASACIFKRFSQTLSWWCPLQSAFAAGSDVQYFRRKIWITEVLIWKSALYWKIRRIWIYIFFWIFHARMHEIRKSETNQQFAHRFAQTAMSKTYDNH